MARRSASVLLAVVTTLALVALVLTLLPRFGAFDLELGDLVIRTQRGHRHPFPAGTGVVASPEREPVVRGRRPRGVVLIIGDGMGLGAVSTGSYLLHGRSGGLFMESAPVVGLVRTAAADQLVTDSAAAASAMATGFKANHHVLSIRPDGSRPTTLFEAARDAGLAFGAVTSSGLVDATPAAFLSHAASRYDYGDILDQMLTSGAEVLIGGTGSNYRKIAHNAAYNALVARLEKSAPGITVVRSTEQLRTAAPPLLALLPPRAPGIDQYGPPVAETGTLAYDLVASDPDGFVLLVECEATDTFAHDNAIDPLTEAVGEVDDATRALVERALARDDVLVITTADHDTGGLALVGDDGSTAEVRWVRTEHTAQLVPLFAWGPGAEQFEGVLDNTQIGARLAALLGLPGLPAPVPPLQPGASPTELAESSIN